MKTKCQSITHTTCHPFAGVVCTGAVLVIVSSAQAQYMTGDATLDNVGTEVSGNFANPILGPPGITLTGTGYTWGQWDIPVVEQQVFSPGDDQIVMTYTINSPSPGTTGPAYTGGAAWTWYALQPLLGDSNGNLVRYFGYDSYDYRLSGLQPGGLLPGNPNQDPGYVYEGNGVVQETGPLSAATEACIDSGGTITYIQISMDPTSALPDGYSVTINSIELVAEPAMLALVGLGLAGLLVTRRRVSYLQRQV